MSTKFKMADYVDADTFFKKLSGELTFGRMLESFRLCEEMSQAAFAKKLRISRSHLCDIEKGRKMVSPARAAKFAKILGYSEKMFVAIALQDILRQDGLKLQVHVKAA